MVCNYFVEKLSEKNIDEMMVVAIDFCKEDNCLNQVPDRDYILQNMQVLGDNFVVFGLRHEGNLVGILAGVLSPDLFWPTVTATECVWYVQKDHRGQGIALLQMFELWAKAMEADNVHVCHLVDSMPEKLQSLYKRCGYKKVDIIWRKELKWD